MRVVGGKYRGRRFTPPKKFPSRPTTDFAKEALFNILVNRYDLEECSILDLFAGTSNISLEFLSRGAKNVLSVDSHRVSHQFMVKTQSEIGDENWQIIRRDAFSFCDSPTESFDIIFADPPFGLDGLGDLIETVMKSEILNENGVLIMEHGQENDFKDKTHFKEIRKYGGVNFSFFEKE